MTRTNTSIEIAYAEKLRADLKTHGLEHAVRLMDVPERGEARRCIRNALAAYVLTLSGGLVEEDRFVLPGSETQDNQVNS